MIDFNQTYVLHDITDEWLAEYDKRADAANDIYDAIERGDLTEELFWADPNNLEKIKNAMSMQIIMFPSRLVPPGHGVIKVADPLIWNVDYVIETRDGKFGVWPIIGVPLLECPTKLPEPHLLGEFPMSCYQCHMEADS